MGSAAAAAAGSSGMSEDSMARLPGWGWEWLGRGERVGRGERATDGGRRAEAAEEAAARVLNGEGAGRASVGTGGAGGPLHGSAGAQQEAHVSDQGRYSQTVENCARPYLHANI